MKFSIGRILQLVGAAAFLFVSFLPWYHQKTSDETAWDGEYSMAAAAGAVVAALFGVLALLKPKGLFNLLSLIGGLAALAFTVLYYQDNSQGFEVYGVFYPSNIDHDNVYAAMGAAALASLGGFLGMRDKSE